MAKKSDLDEILRVFEELTGSKPTFIPTKGRHSKVRTYILGTTQDFPVPSEFRSGCAKNNFYSQMRRKVNERIEAVKARQFQTV